MKSSQTVHGSTQWQEVFTENKNSVTLYTTMPDNDTTKIMVTHHAKVNILKQLYNRTAHLKKKKNDSQVHPHVAN